MTLTTFVHDFSEWTGIPGLAQIINALNNAVRFVWIVIFVALWGVFIYEFSQIAIQFFSYAPAVTLSLNYQSSRVSILFVCVVSQRYIFFLFLFFCMF